MWFILLLTGVVSASAIGFVIWPLFRRPLGHAPVVGEELAELMTRKDAAFQAVRDLAFDHSVGKIEEADFERFNQVLRRRAMALMRQIEEYEPQTVQLEETLEEEIAASRRVEDSASDEGRGRLREE
ncbi:MAG: hypothetical protein OXL39_09625 [Caldilineaceae bacterium]|nr:hypothetical protein [Caldilineaceae bacterium]